MNERFNLFGHERGVVPPEMVLKRNEEPAPEHLHYTPSEIAMARDLTKQMIEYLRETLGDKPHEEYPDDIQHDLLRERVQGRMTGLNFALHGVSDILTQGLDEMITHDAREITHGEFTTRPTSEVVDAVKRVRTIYAEMTPRSSIDIYNAAYLTDNRTVVMDGELHLTGQIEGYTGELEAFDYVLGADNAVADAVRAATPPQEPI